MGGDSRLNTLLQDAESFLVQGDYFKAEKLSRKALASAIELQDPIEKFHFGDEAAVIFLQAAFETKRFSSSAKSCLVTAFGSMQDAPPTTLLVWLSLALETDEACQAHSLILNLLQSGLSTNNTNSSSSSSNVSNLPVQWTRRQYLALLHLYVIDVLLPALRDASEVRLWLQRQPFLPLDPRERLYLEAEVDAAAAAVISGDVQTSRLMGNAKATTNPTTNTTGPFSSGRHQSQQQQQGRSSLDRDDTLGSRMRQNTGNSSRRRSEAVTNSMTMMGWMMPSGDNTNSTNSKGMNASTYRNKREEDGGGSVHSGGGGGTFMSGGDMMHNIPDLQISPIPHVLPFGAYGGENLSPLPSARPAYCSSPLNNNNNNSGGGGGSGSSSSGSGDGGFGNTLSVDAVDALGELDWLGKCQQAAFGAARAVYGRAEKLVFFNTDGDSGSSSTISSAERPAGGTERAAPAPPTVPPSIDYSQAAAAATAAAACVFACAAYSERESIGKVARIIGRSFSDLIGMGLAFTPNPMVAPRRH